VSTIVSPLPTATDTAASRLKTGLPAGEGFFLGACLFDHVKPEIRIRCEEIFEPVLGLVRASNFETALSLVNKHEYGNGIFTRDGDIARDFAHRVQAGMVRICVPIPVPWRSTLSVAGSASATTASTGLRAFHFYTCIKTDTSCWPTGIRKGRRHHHADTGLKIRAQF